MSENDSEPVLPRRIPTAVIVLLIIVIVLITLTGLGIVVMVSLGQIFGGTRGLDLSLPDGTVSQIAWINGVLTLLAMFLIWLFAILVVAAYASGSQRNAASNAVAMVRVSIAILVVRFAANAVIPIVATGSWEAALSVLAAGIPLVVAQIALLIAADAYFCAVRANAPS